MIYTSLAEIRSFDPCMSGWRRILAGQKKTKVDDVLFPLTAALESNCIADVCWLLGKREKEIQICLEFARQCADSVSHLDNDYSKRANDYAAAAAAVYAYAADAAYTAVHAAAAAVEAAAAAVYADAVYATADAVYADAAAEAAVQKQRRLNKSFLHKLITDWEE